MSKTIKEVYDADKTNRNDPSLPGLIPGDDASNTPVTYHIDQLSAAVEFRRGQPLQDDLVVTIPENTLTANILPVSGITYTHYIITVDDDTEPVYPTNFLPAPHALTKDLTAWGTSEVWRMWLYDLPSQTLRAEITAPDGTSGVTVTPNDTIGPDWTNGSFTMVANSGNPNSQIDYTIVAPTDASSGLASSGTYDIVAFDGENETGTIKSGFTSSPGTITVAPGTHSWGCRARDEAGNSTVSDTDSVTITGAGAGGTIGFSTTSFEGTEDDGTIDIILSRSGGTTTATVDVSTVDDTALAGVNYSATLTGDITAGTVEWTNADNTDKTVSLTVNDIPSTYNNQCFIVIDYGSETGTETAVDVPSCRVIINSSNTVGVAGFQQETASGDDLLVIEAENMHTFVEGADTDNWVPNGPNDRYSPDGGNGKTLILDKNNSYGTSTTLNPTAPYTESDINYTSITTTAHIWIRAARRTSGVGERAHITLLRPIATLTETGGTATLTTTADHDFSTSDTIFIEGASVGAYNSTSGFIATVTGSTTLTFPIGGSPGDATAGVGDVMGNTSGLGLYHQGNVPTHIYTWRDQNSSSVDRTLEFPSTGAWKIRVYAQEYDYEWDKIVLTTDGSYDPSTVGGDMSGFAPDTDEYEGPDESSEIPGGGAPVDNPDNTVDLPVPIPDDTTTDGTLVPADGETDVSKSADIAMIFLNMTELEINSFEVTTGGGLPISGTRTNTGDSLRFTHADLIEGNTYTVTVGARIRDTDGVVKQVAVANPPWTFTVANSTDPNYLVYADFEGIATSKPHIMNVSNMVEAHGPASASSQAWDNGITQGRCVIVDDPAELNSQRGDVFRLEEPQNTYRAYNGQINLGSEQDDLWHSFEVYFPPNYDFIYSTKCGFAFVSPNLTANKNNQGREVYFVVHFAGPTPTLPQCTHDGMIGVYRYDAQVTGRYWWGVTSNPSSAPSSCTSTTANYQTFQRERWYRITAHAQMNDVGSDNGLAQLWVDGNLVIDKQTVRWRDTRDPGLGFSRVQPSMRHGGQDNLNFTPNQTQFSYWNNMILSNSTISP